MKIETISRKQFDVSKNGQALAIVKFPSMAKMRAEIELKSGMLKVEPESCWKTTYHVTEETGQPRATIKAKWNGTATVSILNGSAGSTTDYLIVRTGVFSWAHEVKNQNDKVLLDLKGKWSWKSFSHSYTVERTYPLEEELLAELTAYALFVAQVQIRQSSM